jgi:hypothetical protein
MQTAIQTGIDSALQELSSISKNKELLAILLISFGWMVGHTIGRYIMSTDPLYLMTTLFMSVGAAGGISLAAAVKWLVPRLPWARVAIIAAGWFGTWSSVAYVGEIFGIQLSREPQSLAINVVLSGIGGLIMGLSLFWDEPIQRWRRSVNLLFGWAGATGLGIMLSALMSVESWFPYYYVIDEAISLEGLLANFVFGILGASVTIQQLREANIIGTETGVARYTNAVGSLWREHRFGFILLLTAWPVSEIAIMILLVQMDYDTSLIFIVNGFIGASITGYAIMRIRDSVKWIHLVLFAVVWPIFWESRWYIANALGVEIGGFNDGWSLIRLLAAGLAGLSMGFILQISGPRLGWRSVLRIASGWVFGWGLATIIAGYLVNSTQLIINWTTSFADFHIPWILSSVVVGLIGGGFTAREILLEMPGSDQPDALV